MRLVGIEPDQVGAAWERVRPWLAAVCSRGGCDFTADDLRRICEAGEGALTIVMDEANRSVAAVVTQVRDYQSGRRSAWILAIGGSGARRWHKLLQEIERSAYAKGCTCVEFVGRRGWRRFFADYTAQACENGTHYVKELSNG